VKKLLVIGIVVAMALSALVASGAFAAGPCVPGCSTCAPPQPFCPPCIPSLCPPKCLTGGAAACWNGKDTTVYGTTCLGDDIIAEFSTIGCNYASGSFYAGYTCKDDIASAGIYAFTCGKESGTEFCATVEGSATQGLETEVSACGQTWTRDIVNTCGDQVSAVSADVVGQGTNVDATVQAYVGGDNSVNISGSTACGSIAIKTYLSASQN